MGFDKYYLYKQQRAVSGTSNWEDVIPTVLSIDGNGTMPLVLAEADSPDCGYEPIIEPIYRWINLNPLTDYYCEDCEEPQMKFLARYSDSSTYSAACDSNTTLTSGDTRPNGYTYTAMTSAIIGDCVTSIGNGDITGQGAFSDCSSLTSVTIPNSVTTIQGYAFYRCIGITSITIPDSVTTIGEGSFARCSGLTSVTIGSGVTSIGDYAFYYCSGLTSIVIPNSVTTIQGFAFFNCTSLTSIEIPNSVTFIGFRAFARCTGLTSVTIGSGVTSIGDYAFYYCSSLTSIVIPSGVTSIGTAAFAVCSGLTSIDIPSGVTSIGNNAFAGCDSLTSVTIYATTPPTLGERSFDSTNDCPIYVPSRSVNAYQSAWSDYADRIQAIS